MKSNYCTYCPTHTQCEYLKIDGICEKADASEDGCFKKKGGEE